MFFLPLVALLIGQTTWIPPSQVSSVVIPTPIKGVQYRVYQGSGLISTREVKELIRLSDFIGFVRGTEPWYFDESMRVEALKGTYPNSPIPAKKVISIEQPLFVARPHYEVALPGDRQETLIFGRYVQGEREKIFEVITGFRIALDLDAFKHEILMMVNSHWQPVIARNALKTLLIHLIKGEKPDANVLEAFKQSVRIADNGRLARSQAGITYALRRQQAEGTVLKIFPSMTRREVDEILTFQDGGMSGPHATRYYFGAEVMIEVPYDTIGGAWTKTNRVTGKPKIYRSWCHGD